MRAIASYDNALLSLSPHIPRIRVLLSRYYLTAAIGKTYFSGPTTSDDREKHAGYRI